MTKSEAQEGGNWTMVDDSASVAERFRELLVLSDILATGERSEAKSGDSCGRREQWKKREAACSTNDSEAVEAATS